MKRSSKIPLIFFGLVIIAVIAGGVFFVTKSDSLLNKEEEIAEDMVAMAKRRDIETKLFLSGDVAPAFQLEVKSEVGGRVEKIHVATGQTVKRGDLLAEIDDTELQNEKSSALTDVEGAQLVLDKTRGNYERAKQLFEEKLISKEVFSNLEADLRIAENNFTKSERRLKTVNDKLDKTRIFAPADGTVLDILVNEGQVVVAAASVNSGTLLMNFADLSRLLINTHVNQVDAARLEPGQELLVRMQGDNEKPVRARIEFIAPIATVKNNIKGFAVEALILDEDTRLKPGMAVSMDLSVAKAAEVVSVPIAAVFKDEDRRVVYVRKGGNLEKRPVEVGLTNFSFAEIKSGVSEGEEILLVQPNKPSSDKG